jgi:formate hydrogenlyase subunit 6/NADH:ubiquinone oxidoreductase subunit I
VDSGHWMDAAAAAAAAGERQRGNRKKETAGNTIRSMDCVVCFVCVRVCARVFKV